MATTIEDMKISIIDLCGDDVDADSVGIVQGSQLSAQSLIDGIRAAMAAVSKRQWKQGILEVEPDSTFAALPEGFLDVEGVLDLTTGVYLPQVPLQVGGKAPSVGWNLYPSGFITLNKALGAEGGKLYYSAIWDRSFPKDLYENIIESTVLESPDRLDTAVCLYAAHYALLRRSAQSANIRQFGTKVDSGQPENNPLKDMSREFLKLFFEEMKTFPQMQKGYKG